MNAAYYNLFTNIFFGLPVITAWYQKELAYLALAIAIMIVSTLFHTAEYFSHSYFRTMRRIDIVLSMLCYSYMIYFSWIYLSMGFILLAYLGLIVSLGVYLGGKFQKQKYREYLWHGTFHIVIGVVSSSIVLFK